MTNVSFTEEETQNAQAAPAQSSRKNGGMTQWLITHNMAKDEKSASNILAVIAILAFIATFAVWFGTHRVSRTSLPPLPHASADTVSQFA